MPCLIIDEEYGYRFWIAQLTHAELEEIVRVWKTVRGWNYLVPVQMIVPQAREIRETGFLPDFYKQADVTAHLHDWDDSYLVGVRSEEPSPELRESGDVWIDGVLYTRADVMCLRDQMSQQETAAEELRNECDPSA
jgi:hypothetical protein